MQRQQVFARQRDADVDRPQAVLALVCDVAAHEEYDGLRVGVHRPQGGGARWTLARTALPGSPSASRTACTPVSPSETSSQK